MREKHVSRQALPALACCGLLVLFLCSCGEERGRTGTPPAPVRVAKAEKKEMPRVLQAVGNVRPSAQVEITPRVSGEIVEVNFREGQDVKAGQPLVLIDPRPYQAALAEKRGQLAKSEAQLAKARDDQGRYGKLVGQGYVSREAYQQTATDAAALRATVQADRAAVESAALDLSYCRVISPIDGRAGILKIDRGNMVRTGGESSIVDIETLSPCHVAFSAPEAHLPAILELLRNGPVRMRATPEGGAPEDGFLTLVENSVDTRTGSIPLRGDFENAGRNLWPGQFVRVELPLGILRDALVLPSRAVQAGRDESYVYVIDAENRAQPRTVRVLFENGGESAVAGRIEPGERVVVEGAVRLSPGMAVEIRE